MRTVLLLTVLLSLVASVAQADTRAYEKEQLALYQKYAGPPVSEFPMFDLWQWQVVGHEKLVLWPTINTAYLVTVGKPCINLEWTKGLSVSQEMRFKVTDKFDFVNFAHQHCRITEIRPIDYKTMRKMGEVKTGEVKPPAEKSALATKS